MIQRRWPEWFEWELELTPHLLRRMRDRRFSEVDLRRMLADAVGVRKDVVPGRWVVETSLDRKSWEVIVEPDVVDRILVVVTAYRVD